MYYSLFFEARGIQAYIFESGKMKEMVGASELVKKLTSQYLDNVISHLNLQEIVPTQKSDAAKLQNMQPNQVFFSRRSGGVFTAIFADETIRNRFLEIWSIYVESKLPGLECVNACDQGEDLRFLIKNTYDQLAVNRNQPIVSLPESTPLHILAPRTGKPAVKNEIEVGGTRVWVDESTLSKRKCADSSLLSKSFLPLGDNQHVFPKNLDYDENGNCEFPFASNSRYIALIHADGNSLGQTLIRIREQFTNGAEYAVVLRLFSDQLEKATETAAKMATQKLIERIPSDSILLPMRPLVLGGDDLTVIVRADLAMKYTEDFCNEFKQSTQRYFEELHNESNGIIPKNLTACAGIAYIKNNQPFMDAFTLVESLCAESKRISKNIDAQNVPPSVTFQIVSNSFIEDYNTFKKKELTIRGTGQDLIATMGAYALDKEETRLPTLSSLRTLAKTLSQEGISSSSVRQYATMIFGDENISREKWRRWAENLKKEKRLADFVDCLEPFGISNAEDNPWTSDGRTPLFDAIQLLEMETVG